MIIFFNISINPRIIALLQFTERSRICNTTVNITLFVITFQCRCYLFIYRERFSSARFQFHFQCISQQHSNFQAEENQLWTVLSFKMALRVRALLVCGPAKNHRALATVASISPLDSSNQEQETTADAKPFSSIPQPPKVPLFGHTLLYRAFGKCPIA